MQGTSTQIVSPQAMCTLCTSNNHVRTKVLPRARAGVQPNICTRNVLDSPLKGNVSDQNVWGPVHVWQHAYFHSQW